MAYIEFTDVHKVYGQGNGRQIHALDGATFSVEAASSPGASGAGKTTALTRGMDTATSGTVRVDGRDISGASDAQLVEYRRADVGFVFQFYNLVPNDRALRERSSWAAADLPRLDAADTLRNVGLGERMDTFPRPALPAASSSASPSPARSPKIQAAAVRRAPTAPSTTAGKQILQRPQDTVPATASRSSSLPTTRRSRPLPTASSASSSRR